MQYPVCEKSTRYELVAKAIQYPFGKQDYKLYWMLNDGHTAESIDRIFPTRVGQLLVQFFQNDRNRFIIEPKDSINYNFNLSDPMLPYPVFIFADRRIKSGQENYVTIINEDSSADITLTCDNPKVKITKKVNGRFVVVPDESENDKMVEFVAVANYENRVYNITTKLIYVSETKPKVPHIIVTKSGKVGEALNFTVSTDNKTVSVLAFTNNGILEKISDNQFRITRSTEGISKIVAFTIKDGNCSDVVEAEVSFFK